MRTDPHNAPRPPLPQSDQLLIDTMRRIRSSLGAGASRESLASEVSALLLRLGVGRCVVWQVESDRARPLYQYVRVGSALAPASDPLENHQDVWLFSAAQQKRISRTADGALVRCAIPRSDSSTYGDSCLLELAYEEGPVRPLEHHTDASLRFLSDVVCAIFCCF